MVGMTTQDSLKGKPGTHEPAMLFQSLDGIFRATWKKPAAVERQKRGESQLIPSDENDENSCHGLCCMRAVSFSANCVTFSTRALALCFPGSYPPV